MKSKKVSGNANIDISLSIVFVETVKCKKYFYITSDRKHLIQKLSFGIVTFTKEKVKTINIATFSILLTTKYYLVKRNV